MKTDCYRECIDSRTMTMRSNSRTATSTCFQNISINLFKQQLNMFVPTRVQSTFHRPTKLTCYKNS